MRHLRKRKRTLAELYGKLSRSTVWITFTFLSLMSYVAEVRPFINSSFGIYAGGFLDGVLITVLAVVIIFYSLSRITK
jgi:hypothetical protein